MSCGITSRGSTCQVFFWGEKLTDDCDLGDLVDNCALGEPSWQLVFCFLGGTCLIWSYVLAILGPCWLHTGPGWPMLGSCWCYAGVMMGPYLSMWTKTCVLKKRIVWPKQNRYFLGQCCYHVEMERKQAWNKCYTEKHLLALIKLPWEKEGANWHLLDLRRCWSMLELDWFMLLPCGGGNKTGLEQVLHWDGPASIDKVCLGKGGGR